MHCVCNQCEAVDSSFLGRVKCGGTYNCNLLTSVRQSSLDCAININRMSEIVLVTLRGSRWKLAHRVLWFCFGRLNLKFEFYLWIYLSYYLSILMDRFISCKINYKDNPFKYLRTKKRIRYTNLNYNSIQFSVRRSLNFKQQNIHEPTKLYKLVIK